MKFHHLREGMIYEFLQRKTEPDDIERFWEIIELEERQVRGHIIQAIWMGNLGNDSVFNAELKELNQQHRWKYHEGAEVADVKVKRLVFLDGREAMDVMVYEEGPQPKKSKRTVVPIQPEKAPEPEPSEEEQIAEYVEDNPVEELDQTFFDLSRFASYTIDDWESLCYSVVMRFINNGQVDLQKKPPPKKSNGYMVYDQEWSAFLDGKNIREIRNLGLRIVGAGGKCTYETVIIRLIKAGNWFGTPKHRQYITQNVQRRNWKSKEKND